MRGFKITRNKGFHITFDNDVTVSVQFGAGNYCQHHNEEIKSEIPKKDIESVDAEVAIWKKSGIWITREFRDENDDIFGWQSPEQVLEVLNWAKKYKDMSSECITTKLGFLEVDTEI